MKYFIDFLEKLKNIEPILRSIKQQGGVAYLVGGSVRDLVLNKDIKDLDIEVHKVGLNDLQQCLQEFGNVRLVGKQFGVLKIDKFDVDFSLPRKDSKGRKPEVIIDPDLAINDALHRRDLTMNAMAINLNKLIDTNIKSIKDIEIIDPYGGLKHIKNKVIAFVDEDLFLEDPLRFFRVMQFIGRFDMQPDEQLNALCKNMKLEDAISGKALAKERIFEEIKKLLLKSQKPSLGFRWLQQINRLKDIFPEIHDLIGVKQRPDYHPEGDVFEHTMQAVDMAAIFDGYKNEQERFLITLAALLHDVGKAVATDQNLSCRGHDIAGVPIAKRFLKRITNDKDLISIICKLVKYHIRPAELIKQKSGIKAYKRLALKLAPQTNLRQIAILNLADLLGRNPVNDSSPKINPKIAAMYKKEFNNFIQKMQKIKICEKPEEPILKGRDLLEFIKPGSTMGELLRKAYDIQIEEGLYDKEELKKRVLEKKDDLNE